MGSPLSTQRPQDLKWTLASASPRRRALLQQVGINPEVKPAHVEETEEGDSPEAIGRHNARLKLDAILKTVTSGAVLAADTVVVLDDTVLGKPRDDDHAREILRLLSGREHRVITAFALWIEGRRMEGYEVTGVHFRNLDEGDIEAYLATGEPFDKAGAYGIQGAASAFVDGVHGCYFNVVGLPLSRVLTEARRLLGQVIERSR